MSNEMRTIPGSVTGPRIKWVRTREGESRTAAINASLGLPKATYCRCYTGRVADGILQVIVSYEQIDGLKWHISVTHDARCPTWDELKQAKYTLLPSDADVEMSIVFPRKTDDYVDIHKFCLHLWEV